MDDDALKSDCLVLDVTDRGVLTLYSDERLFGVG